MQNETYEEALLRKVRFVEQAGQVMRCHTVPSIHPQSIAAHSYGVAWWCWLLTGGVPSAALLLAALAHDMAEHQTGDIPAPTKRALGISVIVEVLEDKIMQDSGFKMPGLTNDEHRQLKLADALELAQHCVRERALGNRTPQLVKMFHNAITYAKEVAEPHIVERSSIELVNGEWEYHHGKS